MREAEPPSSRRSRAFRLGFLLLVGFIAVGLGLAGTASKLPSFADITHKVRGAFDRTAGAAVRNARVEAAAPEAREAPREAPPKIKKGRNTISFGVMMVPEAFEPGPDGRFDLVIHFHGNTDLTLESFDKLSINAVYVVLNLGTGSGVYEQSFAGPRGMSIILDRVPLELQKRGLAKPRLGRLALSAWSAGYGAVMQVLAQPELAEMVDAVVLLDGFHVPLKQKSFEADPAGLGPITAFAERAMKGERLLVITHSNVEPIGYASVKQTTDLLLSSLALERAEASGETVIPALAAAKGVLPKDEMVALVPVSRVDTGSFHVRGYRGNEPAHHMSHLLQMSEIALPPLAARWRAKRD